MSSVALREANFQSLLHSYYTTTSASKSLKQISGLLHHHKAYTLERLLRDHRIRGNGVPKGPEADDRAAFDKLLKCCSVMEIAVQAGFVPSFDGANPVQRDWAASIRQILENDLVKRYYCEYYPEKNPQLLRYRLECLSAPSQTVPTAESIALIMRFIELDARFIGFLEDGAGHFFLRLLDDWSDVDPESGKSYRFGDIVDIISDPEQFTGILLQPVEPGDPRSSAVYGFVFFLSFASDLVKLLEMFPSQSLLQSAIWHHYGYWFRVLGVHLKSKLSEALNQFLSCTLKLQQNPTDGIDPDVDLDFLSGEIQNYVDETQKVIETLVSAKYSESVDNELLRLASSQSTI
jgi:hypothetical protein